ncbi:MAG: citrate/2-methylcitrate synthase [Actinomycetota bacterium]
MGSATTAASSTPTPPVAAIRAAIAELLDVDLTDVTRDLGIHQLPEWSSIDHIRLMSGLEDRFGCVIDGDAVRRLTTVDAIEMFLAGAKPLDEPDGPADDAPPPERVAVRRGLADVYVDTSSVTAIDGSRGSLRIRGYDIDDLVAHGSFEEALHLVLSGERPSPADVARIRRMMGATDDGLDAAVAVVRALASAHPVVALRSAVSAIGTAGPGSSATSGAQIRATAVEMVATLHVLLAHHHAVRRGEPLGHRGPADASVAEQTMRLHADRPPTAVEIEAMDLMLTIGVDHGANASAFAARVTASAGTDLPGAIVTALSTFAGELHGGAADGVLSTLREIGHPNAAQAHVDRLRGQREPVMGFGHRVYRTQDPRVAPLRTMAHRLCARADHRHLLHTMTALEQAMADSARHGLAINVDPYLALITHMLGFPDDYGTAIYAMSRAVGWCAHVAEQVDARVLIRPRLGYNGPAARRWGTAPAADGGAR